jgi:hypothetical protein
MNSPQAQSENDRSYWFDDLGEQVQREYLDWLSVQYFKAKQQEEDNGTQFSSQRRG